MVVGLIGCSGDDDKKSSPSQDDAGSQADSGVQGDLPMTAVFDDLVAAECDRQLRCESSQVERQKCMDDVAAGRAADRKEAEGKISRCSRPELDKCMEDYKNLPCDGEQEPPCDCDTK